MKSDIISENTVKLMKLIDCGNLQISEVYVDLVIKIHIFFQELIKFSQKISKIFFKILTFLQKIL